MSPSGSEASDFRASVSNRRDTLLETAAWFDLRYPWERKRSARLLRELTIALHAHLGAQAIFEIGAWEASFSRAVRRHAPDARIYAFEANPHNFERFGKDAELARLGIRYLNRAISDRSGPIEFQLQTKKGKSDEAVSLTAKSNSLLRQSRSGEYQAVTVAGSSLADFLAEENLIGAPSTAWIDVEGAMGQVLTGLGEHAAQFQLLHCEVEDAEIWSGQWTANRVFDWLEERGFVAVARDFERPSQFNVLFLRQSLLSKPEIEAAVAGYRSLCAQTRSRWNTPRLWLSRLRAHLRSRRSVAR
jgi:FkbM family methyltransferase